MTRSVKWWTRKLHRWGALIALIPLLLVITTGLLLQLKKQVAWVQPTTMKGADDVPQIGWDSILSAAQSIPESGVDSWNDIDRLDVRPGKGVIKIRCKNHWELQIDSTTGELLSSSYRRSDVIESLHDGSFFSDNAKLGIFLPNGLILLALWFTGIYLWWMPIGARRRKKRRRQSEAGRG